MSTPIVIYYRILIIHSYIHILNTCKFKLCNSAIWLLCNFAINKLSIYLPIAGKSGKHRLDL